jgi:DNA-binding transcriptional MerR regulator
MLQAGTMMNIGEFAALTGLGVKGLRHHDERGVLRPAAVDPVNGYRKYGEDQVRVGVILKALRDAGVPVPEAAAAAAIEAPDEPATAVSPIDALEAHREAVLAARLEEDRAHERALDILRALARPVEVAERTRPPQPYVATTLRVAIDPTTAEPDSYAATDDDVERVTLDLMQALADDGIVPSGPLWITMRATDRETVDVLCCLPVPHALPHDWGGNSVEAGELPERVELCAVWPGDSAELQEGVIHPAMVALLDAYAHRAGTTDIREVPDIRQTATGTSAEDWTVELAVTLR